MGLNKMEVLSHINLCCDVNSINDGDLLVIQRKQDKRKILVQCKEVLYRNTGKEEVLLSRKNNDYFIWSMFQEGTSWVWRVWKIGPVELTNITNNMKEFPRR